MTAAHISKGRETPSSSDFGGCLGRFVGCEDAAGEPLRLVFTSSMVEMISLGVCFDFDQL
jgi:hypothetical protein